MSVVPALVCVGLDTAVSIVLFAIARHRVTAVLTSSGDYRVHEVRALGRRMSRVAAGCGGGLAALYLELINFRFSGVLSVCVAVVIVAACLTVPVAVTRWPILSAYARLRGVPASSLISRKRLAARLTSGAVSLLPIVLALALTLSLTARISMLIVGYVVVCPVLLGLLAPVTARLLSDGAAPADLAARISDLALKAGVRVHGRVTGTIKRREANARQVGWLPGLHYLLVGDYLIGALPEPQGDAVLCHELAHAAHHDGLIRQLIICSSVASPSLVLVVAITDPKASYLAWAFVLWFATLLGLGRLLSALMIRQEIAADDFAARLVGREAVAAALVRLTQMNEIKPDTSASWDRMVGHPGMAKRIARLQASPAAS
jgi:Zn-dependent protease with chaperone function